QTGTDAGAQDEGQDGSNPNETSEGQARSNPDETSEGQAGPDPGDAGAKVKSIPSLVVHAGSDREHMDLDVLFEEPASSSRTLSSLQHLSKDISFGDLFFSDRPSDADKNAKTKVESMVNVSIQQAMSSISLMTSPIIDLSLRPESPKEHQQLKATTTDTTTTTTTTTLPSPPAQQQRTAEAMMVKYISELEHIMATLVQVNKEMEERLDSHGSRLYTLEQLDIPQQVSIAADIKEILHQRMWETESYKSHKDHMQLFEALEKSMDRDHSKELAQDLAEVRKKKKKSRESPKTPPGSPSHQPPLPPPPAGPSRPSGTPGASESSQPPPPPPPPSLTSQENLELDMDMDPDEQAQLSDDEDIRIPTNNWASALASNYSPPPPKDLLLMQTGDISTFMDWFCKRRGITELTPQDLEGPAYELVKVFHPDVIHLQYQMEECHKLLTDSVEDPILRHNISKPLPLGGPPGQVTIQSDFFFNKDLEYLRYGSKGRRPALSISKIKVAYYPDAGLEQMVPDYAVRTHIRILSVVRIEVFSMYGYDYMKKIVLRRADLNEHVITERDFKYLYPSDFEDLYMLNLQGHLNHLPPKDKKILTTDGTLQQIDEALDYQVKEFRINRMTPGLNTRFWTRKDVDQCKAFMFAIQRHLRTRRIFHNLESFVGGRVAVCSSLRSLKSKRTIESRAKRSSKIISLRHYPIMLASSHTVKSKTDIKSLTHYPCGLRKKYRLNLKNDMPPRDKPNGDALRKCILGCPYTPTVTILVVPTTDDSPKVPERTAVKAILNMSLENKAHYESEKEAIHLLLTGIRDEIYSTIDAIAKNANPLALVASGQQYPDPYYQALKSHKSYAPPSKQSSSTRSNASTKYKDKEIAKPITTPSELASEEEDSDPEQAHRYKDIYKNDNQTRQFGNQRTVTVVGARETIGSQVVQQTRIQCFNYKEFGHFAKECRKPKRVKDYSYHKEKMLLRKQAEKGVPLQAEQADWLADTNEEIDKQ
nr:hypothetical protein [Tanacetum cinerariifolium]